MPVIISRSERGQVAVFFALLLPVLFGIGAVVIDLGNWYIHKRHLQTQVDAAALAPAPEFTGCFDPAAWATTDQAIEDHAIGFAGDTLRPGILGTNPLGTTNTQLSEPGDVRVALNATRYWSAAANDPKDAASAPDGYGLDQKLDEKGPLPGSPPDGVTGFCNEGYIDVKATDEDVPFLLGLLPFAPDPKSHARAKIFDIDTSEGILPFAVPEVVPGSVYALFVNEDHPDATAVISRARLCGDPCAPVPTPPTPPPGYPSQYAVYQGSNVAQPITFGSGTENVGVIILVSRSDIANPNVGSPSIATTCSQTGVRCYSGGGALSGLALIHGYETGSGPGPIARRVDVGGCTGAPNLSGPYYVLEDCTVSINAELDFSGFVNPQARTHQSPSCGGSGTDMSPPGGPGGVWTSFETLPEPDPGGQVPISISWRATGVSGGWQCMGLVARPYVKNAKGGPVYYLKLTAAASNPPAIPNAYSTPNEPSQQPVTYTVTAGLLPPLKTQTLSDKPVLIRFASEDNPSLTQSIDCDVDSWAYPAPYDSMPKDAAEIAHGCVTPYSENPTLDCSGYSLGELPPPMPGTTFDNAPDCAQSKNGSVSSLRKGLVTRLNEYGDPPACAPNNWPDPPITEEKITNLVTNFDDDPRLVTLVVTEFQAFSGSGSTIIPIRYFAGFYITGKDVSPQSPRCDDEDLHPIYGDTYSTPKRQKLDDGDVWGYFVVRVEYGSGAIGHEDCDFVGAPENCVLALVR